ncbi:PQQ-dependent sugar dehydrogenase [Pontibacter sp. HJ8]
MKASLSYLLLLSLFCSCSPESAAQYQLQEAYPNLKFTDQVEAATAGDNKDRLYVVEQEGIISWIPAKEENAAKATPFLDITDRVVSGGERGLLGLAFHPDFGNNGYFYVNYTTSDPLQTRISRFTVHASNPNQADPGSERVLLTYTQPYPNHNGGKIAFGPDGYLYISAGDGGSGGDPQNNAQNRKSLLGKILRIDVDKPAGGNPYGIPADNPYANNKEGFRQEIFAYGLRNVWKFSFDRQTNRLWAADVGQNAREEINLIENGGNYGWRIMEGTACYNPSSNCNTSGLLLPVLAYTHASGDGRSVTGGFVYYGSRMPELRGKYIYGDFASGNIWALTLKADGTLAGNTLLLDAGFQVSAFAEDLEGEILVLSHGSGEKLYRLTSTVTGTEEEDPEALKVYPNPARSLLFIDLQEASIHRVEKASLYNNLGQLVKAAANLTPDSEGISTLDIRGLSKGNYTLYLEAGNRKLRKKLLLE